MTLIKCHLTAYTGPYAHRLFMLQQPVCRIKPFKLVSSRLSAYLPFMQFSQDTSGGNSIQAYRQGEIIVNERRINCSVVITPDEIIEWAPQNFEAITSEHIDQLTVYQPEIIILGTGERQQFPAPHITAGLLVQGIGVEIMNTDAACRTFNVLLSENRRVVTAMILK